jgi:L-methionine (R)-S-oxide reductase
MDAQEVIAQLDRLAAAGAPLAELLAAAVRGVHGLSPRFHWTGIYALDADGVLRLGPFVGTPTEHTAIPVGQGVCGTAVAEGRDLNVPDVRAVGNYLACSLETRSELVVLIRTGATVHAQIDIDSHEVAAFDASAEAAVRAVAERLAAAYAGAAGGGRRRPA